MQKPNENHGINELNEAIIALATPDVISQKLKTISVEQLNSVQPFEKNPLYLSAVRGNIEAVLLLENHGVNLNISEKGDNLLDVIMKQSKCFDDRAKMALLLASLGARFNKEDDNYLALADYTHRKVFEDFFYSSIPAWRRTREHLNLCFHKACELNLLNPISTMLDYSTPEKVMLKQHHQPNIKGNTSPAQAYQTNPGLNPVRGRTPIFFENHEKQSLVEGLTAAQMAPAPQHQLSAEDQDRLREINEQAREKLLKEHAEYAAQLPSEMSRVINVNGKGDNYITALHIASRLGYKKLIVWLLEEGADPLAKTKDGETPAQFAIRNDVAQELIQPLLNITKEKYPTVKKQSDEQAQPVEKKAGPIFIASIVKYCQSSKPNYNMFKVFANKITCKDDWQEISSALLNKTNLIELLKQFLKENPNYDKLPQEIYQLVMVEEILPEKTQNMSCS